MSASLAVPPGRGLVGFLVPGLSSSPSTSSQFPFPPAAASTRRPDRSPVGPGAGRAPVGGLDPPRVRRLLGPGQAGDHGRGEDRQRSSRLAGARLGRAGGPGSSSAVAPAAAAGGPIPICSRIS